MFRGGQIDRFLGKRRDGLDWQTDILAAGLELAYHVAHGVSTVALDDVDRIDAVALGLAHHLALAVEDVGVDEAVRER